jgi:ornithine decarboxylase
MVIRTLYDAGVKRFDVASFNEIAHISSICPEAKLHFNNPIKWKQSIIDSYYDYGVRSFVVDDMVGLQQILKHCSEREPLADNSLEITVRFTLPKGDAAYYFGSKFGATPVEAVEILKAVKAAKQRCSITFHPGSQCTDPTSYASYIGMAAKIAEDARAEIAMLNVGGGFPIGYDNYQIEPLEQFFTTIKTAFAQTTLAKQAEPAILLCEPGRAMVADCVSLLTQVIHKRDNGTIFLNDGVYGSFQEQLIVKLDYPITCWRVAERIEEAVVDTAVFGPTCDPVDQLGTMPLPASLQEGDWVEFDLMGAYSGVTATHFNGYVIPEYLLLQAQ